MKVDANRLKKVTRELIHAAGGIEASARDIGVSIAQVGRYQNVNEKGFINLAGIAILEEVTTGTDNHPIISRHLATRAGYALVKLPEIGADKAQILSLLSTHAKESGDIVAGICGALKNGGEIYSHECAQIRTQIGELIQVLVTMDSELAFIEEQS